MQRFTISRMLAWTLAWIFVLPLVCPPKSSAQQPSVVRVVTAAPLSPATSQPNRPGEQAQCVAAIDTGAVLRLPIALVPGRGCEKMGLAPSRNGENPGKSAVSKVPVPIFSQPGRVDLPTGTDATAGSESKSLSLAPRKTLDRTGRTAVTKPEQALLTTATSLAVVVGLFLLLVWLQRRMSGRNGLRLPGAVVQTLGRVPLNSRQEMQLVQVGNKLLLLAVTATSAETLTEITDPAEIARLNGICQHDHPGSISASFREILSQLQQPASSRPIR